MTSNDTGGWTAGTFTELQFFLWATEGSAVSLDTLCLLAMLLQSQQLPRHAVAQTDGRERKLLTILSDTSMFFCLIHCCNTGSVPAEAHDAPVHAPPASQLLGLVS